MNEPTLDNLIKTAVEKYQCPGCVCGMDTSCYEKGINDECGRHVLGILLSDIGKIFLGMPIGFTRVGPFEDMKLSIFRKFKDGWGYDKFNVPVWKHLDERGNTLVRGINPRINSPFLHIFIGDQMNQIDCLEITTKDINEMD